MKENGIVKLAKPYLDVPVAFVQWLEITINYIRMEIKVKQHFKTVICVTVNE